MEDNIAELDEQLCTELYDQLHDGTFYELERRARIEMSYGLYTGELVTDEEYRVLKRIHTLLDEAGKLYFSRAIDPNHLDPRHLRIFNGVKVRYERRLAAWCFARAICVKLQIAHHNQAGKDRED